MALTADAYSQDRDKCQAAGMNHFLTKPLLAEELRTLLVRVFSELDPADIRKSA